MMARNTRKTKRRNGHDTNQPAQDRKPVRLAPTDDPAEAVERMISRRQLIVEEGDVIISREAAGLLHQPQALSTLSAPSKYRLSIRGQRDERRRVFAMFERAVVDGEALAAERRVRLFYAEDTALTLLKDYRPAPRI